MARYPYGSANVWSALAQRLSGVGERMLDVGRERRYEETRQAERAEEIQRRERERAEDLAREQSRFETQLSLGGAVRRGELPTREEEIGLPAVRRELAGVPEGMAGVAARLGEPGSFRAQVPDVTGYQPVAGTDFYMPEALTPTGKLAADRDREPSLAERYPTVSGGGLVFDRETQTWIRPPEDMRPGPGDRGPGLTFPQALREIETIGERARVADPDNPGYYRDTLPRETQIRLAQGYAAGDITLDQVEQAFRRGIMSLGPPSQTLAPPAVTPRPDTTRNLTGTRPDTTTNLTAARQEWDRYARLYGREAWERTAGPRP